jgi:hypothetical protein
MNFRILKTLVLTFFCASASFLQAQKLNVDYPEIRLMDGRILSEASVSSFDKKNLTFCVSHRHGIEGAVPWGAMPTVWQTAFPLEGADVQRGAEQIAMAKKAPGMTGRQGEFKENKNVVRSNAKVDQSNDVINYGPTRGRAAPSTEEIDPSERRLAVMKMREDAILDSHAAARAGDSKKAVELQDKAAFIQNYENYREAGLNHDEAGQRASRTTEDEILGTAPPPRGSAQTPDITMHRGW